MPDAYRWNAYALPWAFVAIALFVLAKVIYRRQRASRVAVLFCAMIEWPWRWGQVFAFPLALRPGEPEEMRGLTMLHVDAEPDSERDRLR